MFPSTSKKTVRSMKEVFRVSCATAVAHTEKNECIFIQIQLLVQYLAKVFVIVFF